MTALERTSSDATIERLSTPSAVALFWIGLSLVFAAIQLLSSSTLTLDSAVTVENVQRHLAGGYQLRNPPLFDWMYKTEPDLLSGQLARDSLVLCHRECESVKTGKAVAV